MGCHTWIYIAPKNQEEILSKILKDEHDLVLSFLNEPDEDAQECYDLYKEYLIHQDKEYLIQQDDHSLFDKFKETMIKEHTEALKNIDAGIPQNLCDYNGNSYRFRNNKIYLEKNGGDSLGRIPGFYDNEFYDANSVLKAFKDNNCECDEEKIKELFSKNDAVLIFG